MTFYESEEQQILRIIRDCLDKGIKKEPYKTDGDSYFSCPSCHADLKNYNECHDDDKFCPKCGQALSHMTRVFPKGWL